jgi:hypothetical protein
VAEFTPKPSSFLPDRQSSRVEEKLASPAPVSPLTILGILFRQVPQSLPVFDLQTLSGIAPRAMAML